MKRAALFALIAIIALGTAGAAGYRTGRALLQGELDAAEVGALNRAADTAIRLAAAEQERAKLARELEDAANQEPVQVPVALPRSRILRLNARIDAANSAGP